MRLARARSLTNSPSAPGRYPVDVIAIEVFRFSRNRIESARILVNSQNGLITSMDRRLESF